MDNPFFSVIFGNSPNQYSDFRWEPRELRDVTLAMVAFSALPRALAASHAAGSASQCGNFDTCCVLDKNT